MDIGVDGVDETPARTWGPAALEAELKLGSAQFEVDRALLNTSCGRSDCCRHDRSTKSTVYVLGLQRPGLTRQKSKAGSCVRNVNMTP